MSHIIILDKTKALSDKLIENGAVAVTAHFVVENEMTENDAAINTKVDEIADFISDFTADLEGKTAELNALL